MLDKDLPTSPNPLMANLTGAETEEGPAAAELQQQPEESSWPLPVQQPSHSQQAWADYFTGPSFDPDAAMAGPWGSAAFPKGTTIDCFI